MDLKNHGPILTLKMLIPGPLPFPATTFFLNQNQTINIFLQKTSVIWETNWGGIYQVPLNARKVGHFFCEICTSRVFPVPLLQDR